MKRPNLNRIIFKNEDKIVEMALKLRVIFKLES